MALLTEAAARQAARSAPGSSFKTTDRILAEFRETQQTSFDVFLSHAVLDSELVLGVKTVLERRGQSVYVDWLNDPLLDRSKVTPATADRLRKRMRQCKSMIYVYTRNATDSRWMPWELGYFDAFNGNVAVLQVAQSSTEVPYRGEEFVGLYPYVDLTDAALWVHRSGQDYASITEWRSRPDKLRPVV